MENGEGKVNVTYRTRVISVSAPKKIDSDDETWTENGAELYKIVRPRI
jgi:hypothetical protein